MATLIEITRNGNTVTFQTVNIISAELVVWVNKDPLAAHWPELSPNQIGPFPSPNSSAVGIPSRDVTTTIQAISVNTVTVSNPTGISIGMTLALYRIPVTGISGSVITLNTPLPSAFKVGGNITFTPLPFPVTYKDKLGSATGIINVFAPFQTGIPNGTGTTNTLPPAAKGVAITPQIVATGGMTPYTINSQAFQVTNSSGQIIQSGSGSPGPGMVLSGSSNNGGLMVRGAPTLSGTYTFTFDSTDGMGLNVQQTQFTMVVT